MVPANRQVYELEPLGYCFYDFMSFQNYHVVIHSKTVDIKLCYKSYYYTTGTFQNDPVSIISAASDPQLVEDRDEVPLVLGNEDGSNSMEPDDNESIVLENEEQQHQQLACKRIAVEIISLVGEEGVSWKAVEKMAAIYKGASNIQHII